METPKEIIEAALKKEEEKNELPKGILQDICDKEREVLHLTRRSNIYENLRKIIVDSVEAD